MELSARSLRTTGACLRQGCGEEEGEKGVLLPLQCPPEGCLWVRL